MPTQAQVLLHPKHQEVEPGGISRVKAMTHNLTGFEFVLRERIVFGRRAIMAVNTSVDLARGKFLGMSRVDGLSQ